jgi:hypothetical protein
MSPNPLGLTPEEAAYVAYAAYARNGWVQQIGWYVAVALPSIALATFGAVRHDEAALITAFSVLLAVLLLRIPGQMRSGRIFRAVCCKIGELERRDGGMPAASA